PQPMHHGQTLLTESRDFKLPFAIYQEAEEIRAKVDAKRKPPAYSHIRVNQYYSRPKLHGEVPICQCSPGQTCADDCMNRIIQYICNPRTCPCGDKCTNISLGKRPGIKTDVAYYGARGFGLKALEPVKRGGFIDEYRGEIIDLKEAAKRVTESYKYTGNFYFLDYDAQAGEVLDGGRKGNVTRFANHSCNPNCYIEKWLVCGTDEKLTAEFQIGLFALRDISAGEELTYDYGESIFPFSPASLPVSAHSDSARLFSLLSHPRVVRVPA
ncbi:SET domain-containing protein, partial [Violaceomyces palustris]